MSNDEIELIALIVNGDNAAYRSIVDRYKDNIYRHCFYILRDEDLAEDMAQETFIRAYNKLTSFDANKASFKTWLYTIATRQCLQEMRKHTALPLLDDAVIVSTYPSPEEQAMHREIYAAVQKLQPTYRIAVMLHYWHGYSYEDIALYMNVPIGTVRSWLHRAKQVLKEVLS